MFSSKLSGTASVAIPLEMSSQFITCLHTGYDCRIVKVSRITKFLGKNFCSKKKLYFQITIKMSDKT